MIVCKFNVNFMQYYDATNYKPEIFYRLNNYFLKTASMGLIIIIIIIIIIIN